MKSTRLGSLVALFLLAALPACHRPAEDKDEPEASVSGDHVTIPEKSPALPSIVTAAAKPASAHQVRLGGRLVWNEDVTVRIYAPFAGRVEKVLADSAQTVSAGDTLALIASADFAQARADALRAAADFTLAEGTRDRLQTLFDHGAAPQKELLAAEADVARSRAEKDRAETTLKIRGGLSDAEGNFFGLRSPIAGIVVEKNINPGQEVRPDQILANAPQFYTPLFVVSDPTRLWLLLDATERDLKFLRPGMALNVRCASLPDETFKGTLEAVADALDPTTRMIRVRARVENTDRRLKAEMFVTADLESAENKGVELPVTSVIFHGEDHFVYIEEKTGVFRRCLVRVGDEQENRVQVTEGVNAGDRVVAEGSLLLEKMHSDAAGS